MRELVFTFTFTYYFVLLKFLRFAPPPPIALTPTTSPHCEITRIIEPQRQETYLKHVHPVEIQISLRINAFWIASGAKGAFGIASDLIIPCILGPRDSQGCKVSSYG